MMEESNYPSSNETPSTQGKQSESSAKEQNVENLVNQALERKQTIQNLDQLRSRVSWLTAFFVIAIIAFGSGLGWISYRLQEQQKQLVNQNENPENLENLEENLERVQQLEDQVEELQEQVPNSQTIERLENQLDEVTTAVGNNQKTLERMLERVQTQDSQEELPDNNFSDSVSPSNETENSN